MNLQTMRNRVYIHTRDFKRERFDPLLIDRLLSEAQEEFNGQTKIFRTSTDLTTDAKGTADLVTSTNNGQIASISITNSGAGYNFAPTVTVAAPSTGVTATAVAVVQNNALTQIVITNPGSGYTTAPAVTIANGVSAVTVTAGGSGYSTPTVTFSAPPAGGVTATGTATVVSGAVTAVTITNPGSGYTSAPSITFGGPGTSATATAILSSGGAATANLITQDSIAIQGEILRVEDKGSTPSVALVRTSEEALDVLVGPQWRSTAVGSPQFYIRGKGGIQYAGFADASTNYNGYEAITIYPLVASRAIRVWYVKRPPDMIADFDTPSIPEHYHMALVWHATSTLLAESMAEGDNAKSQQAAARYQEFVKRGIEEADQSLRWR